ncbi:MAG: hypothetical protein ACKO81_11005 [Planctomycetota bacterium]
MARSEPGNNVVYVHAGQQVIADYARGAAAAAPSFRYVYGSYVDEPLLRHAGTGTTLPTSGSSCGWRISGASKSSPTSVLPPPKSSPLAATGNSAGRPSPRRRET